MNSSKVFSTVLLVALYLGTALLVPLLGLPQVPTLCITAVVLLVGTHFIFSVYDSFNPRPSNLGLDDVKAWFTSKIFWTGFVSFLALNLNGLLGIDVDGETQNEILSIDWSKIVPALGSVLIIALRKFDILKLLIR